MLPELILPYHPPHIILALLYGACGISIFTFLNSLFVWYKQTKENIHLCFALTTISALSYTFLAIQAYQATNVADMIFWVKMKLFVLIIFEAIFAWLIMLFTNNMRPRLMNGLLMACAIFFLINIVHPYPFLTGTLYGISSHTLPWGEVVHTIHGRIGLYGVLWIGLIGVVLTLPVHALWNIKHHTQKRREINALVFCCGVFSLTATNDILVENGLDNIFLSEFGFIIVTLTMAYYLSNQLGDALRQRSEALGRTNLQLEKEVTRRTESLSDSIRDLEEARDTAQKATLAKTYFLANMSHEIRTPMNGIIGMTDLAMQHANASQQKYLTTIQISAHRLLDVINNILDFAKIGSEKLEIEQHPFILAKTIQDTLAPLQTEAHLKGLDLQIDISPALPKTVVGDSHRLCQVISHLVANGIKFTQQGGISIFISQGKATGTGAISLDFEVQDSGPGIPQDKQQEIFHPFTLNDTSYTRKHIGTGLGLAISRELVSLMGGELRLREGQQTGTAFLFSLPFTLETEQKSSPSVPRFNAPQNPSISIAGSRILLVEDEEINRMLAEALLEQEGLEVRCAEHGLAAVEMYEPDEFDLVLMDIQMPVMDGFSATALIRVKEPQGTHIPIIATTAHAMSGYRERCLAAGMDDYLTKPFKDRELADMITKWLHKIPV